MRSANVNDLTTNILETTGIDSQIMSMENGQEHWDNVTQLLEFCKEYGPATETDGLAAMLDRITLMDQTKDKEHQEPPITLCTLHKAQGTKFPNVAIVGMYEGSIPNGNADDPRKKGASTTPAADNLTLIRPRRARGRQTEPSRYLDEISQLVEII